MLLKSEQYMYMYVANCNMSLRIYLFKETVQFAYWSKTKKIKKTVFICGCKS